MTKKAICEAASNAVNKGEDLELYQAVTWFEDYNLIDYKTARVLYQAILDARNASAPFDEAGR